MSSSLASGHFDSTNRKSHRHPSIIRRHPHQLIAVLASDDSTVHMLHGSVHWSTYHNLLASSFLQHSMNNNISWGTVMDTRCSTHLAAK